MCNTNEEIEGSQLGGAQAAVSGASPYHPTDLSDKIFDIHPTSDQEERNEE